MPPLDDPSQLPGPSSDVAALAARVLALEQQVAELRAQLPDVPRIAERRPAAVLHAVPVPHGSPPVAESSFSRDASSFESNFGAKILSKVAVLLLLAGAAWFLKWAYENAWIGPRGRVIAGLAAGIGIILWSERFRRTGTPAFSSTLKAVGSGILYLSLWASFQLYHLLPAPIALLLMIAVTAWNAVLALTQDSRLLAAYALAGAYLTPVLLSTGGNHEIFLLLYLASIAAAVVALLRFRAWNILLIAPIPATTAFFIAWYLEFFTPQAASLTLALCLLLWGIFATVPLVARDPDDALAGALQPLAAAIFGALTVYSILADSNQRAAEPWAAAAFAAAYLALSRIRAGSVVSAIHLSLALTFLTVAIPLKLTGHGITVAWLAESLAVFWIATLPTVDPRARTALRWLGLAAMLLGTAGAFLHLDIGPARPFFNRDFATAFGALITLAAAALLHRRGAREPEDSALAAAIAPLAFVLFNVLLLAAVSRELGAAFHGEAADFAISAAIALQGALMLALGFWQRQVLARWAGLLLLAVTLVKTVFYDLRSVGTGYRVVSYLALGALLLAVSFAYQKDWLSLRQPTANDTEPPQEQPS